MNFQWSVDDFEVFGGHDLLAESNGVISGLEKGGNYVRMPDLVKSPVRISYEVGSSQNKCTYIFLSL